MYNFAVTLKVNHLPVEDITQEHYEEWIRNAKLYGFELTDYYFELDSKGRLHLHGIGHHERKNFLRKSLMFNRMHQRIDHLPTWLDVETWTNYMRKELEEEKVDAYMFID